MDEQKRLFLAMGLCAVIFIAWMWLQEKQQSRRPHPMPPRPPATATVPPSTPPVSPPPTPASHEAQRSFQTAFFSGELSSLAALTQLSLNDYREATDTDQPREPVSLVTASVGGAPRQALVSFAAGT